MYPCSLPVTPARIVWPLFGPLLHAPGLGPAFVTNVPWTRRVKRKLPSSFRLTLKSLLTVSVAQLLPQEPLSSRSTVTDVALPSFGLGFGPFEYPAVVSNRYANSSHSSMSQRRTCRSHRYLSYRGG